MINPPVFVLVSLALSPSDSLCSPSGAIAVQVCGWRPKKEADPGQVSPEWPTVDTGRRGKAYMFIHSSEKSSPVPIIHDSLPQPWRPFIKAQVDKGYCNTRTKVIMFTLGHYKRNMECFPLAGSCCSRHFLNQQ